MRSSGRRAVEEKCLAAGGRFLFGEGLSPTIRNRLEAALPQALTCQGFPLGVKGDRRCSSLRREPGRAEQSCTPREVPLATKDDENKLSRSTVGTGHLGQTA